MSDLAIITEHYFSTNIYYIRNKKVMIDSDLAEFYAVDKTTQETSSSKYIKISR